MELEIAKKENGSSQENETATYPGQEQRVESEWDQVYHERTKAIPLSFLHSWLLQPLLWERSSLEKHQVISKDTYNHQDHQITRASYHWVLTYRKGIKTWGLNESGKPQRNDENGQIRKCIRPEGLTITRVADPPTLFFFPLQMTHCLLQKLMQKFLAVVVLFIAKCSFQAFYNQFRVLSRSTPSQLIGSGFERNYTQQMLKSYESYFK